MQTVITKAEVKRHRHRNSLWLILHDEVYDVTKYLEEHPGGEDVLLDNAGKDATQPFEDVGHSQDAREVLTKYKIGTLPDDEKIKIPVPPCCKSKTPRRPNQPCVKECDSKISCMIAHRMSKRDNVSRRSSASGCLEANKPPPSPNRCEKKWRSFDTPVNSSNLTRKSSKSARFLVPPDKCDEEPSTTAAVSRIDVENEDSKIPKVKKKTKKGCPKKRERGPPCGECGPSYWKWLALATFLIGAIAVGVMVAKKNA